MFYDHDNNHRYCVCTENDMYSKVFLLENTCEDEEINLPHPVGDINLFHKLKVLY